MFQSIGLSFEELSSFQPADLTKIPVLEKNTIRLQNEEFISLKCSSRSLHEYSTSGTTGTPLTVKFSNKMQQTWAAAYETRCRNWAGVNYKMSRAMIGGRLVAPKVHSPPPFWRYNAVERQLYMSAFHISAKTANSYAKALNHYKPEYLVGYASSHYFLARFLFEQKISVHHPKAVMTSSEKLTEEMRSVIEAVYQCKVFDAYSGVEACCLTSECECHQMHISPDVGIVELLDGMDQPVKPGQAGQIVATGLLNYDQPLIRYKTGDWAIMSTEPCKCGRAMPVLTELVGRLEDTVIGADGREMVRFHGIFVGLPHVIEGQVIQEELSKFRLKLVVDPAFGEAEKKIIRNRFYERLGQVTLTFEFVDHIERTERGKFRSVISKVVRN